MFVVGWLVLWALSSCLSAAESPSTHLISVETIKMTINMTQVWTVWVMFFYTYLHFTSGKNVNEFGKYVLLSLLTADSCRGCATQRLPAAMTMQKVQQQQSTIVTSRLTRLEKSLKRNKCLYVVVREIILFLKKKFDLQNRRSNWKNGWILKISHSASAEKKKEKETCLQTKSWQKRAWQVTIFQ